MSAYPALAPRQASCFANSRGLGVSHGRPRDLVRLVPSRAWADTDLRRWSIPQLRNPAQGSSDGNLTNDSAGTHRGYHDAMTNTTELRTDLIENLRACREAERAIFAALDPATRDAPSPTAAGRRRTTSPTCPRGALARRPRWPPSEPDSPNRPCPPRASTPPTRSSTTSAPAGPGTRSTPTPTRRSRP